jgi:hypothetical protein
VLRMRRYGISREFLIMTHWNVPLRTSAVRHERAFVIAP